MSIVSWIRERLFGSTPDGAERRRNERYEVASGLEIIVGDQAHGCLIDNVSAGGVRVTPALDVPIGTVVSVCDPATAMRLDGSVLGHDDGGTRLQFASEDAGIIVSTWLRMAQEKGGAQRPSDAEGSDRPAPS